MSYAGRLDLSVISMDHGPQYSGFFQMDTTDPYIRCILHDGKFQEGGSHIGEKCQTRAKQDSGKSATWHEDFHLSKGEKMDNLRVELWDENVVSDDMLGSIDLDLDLFQPNAGPVEKTVNLVKDGRHVADVKLKLSIVV